jgi:hypothetical protein
VEGDRVPPGVAAEQPGRPGVGPQQAEQDAEGGGLPGPVGAEEAVTSPVRTVRSSPSSARVGPNVLTSPSVKITGSIIASISCWL